MNPFTRYGKKITAALLLGLLVYIPVEKNWHGHRDSMTVGSTQEKNFYHSSASCLICDYQLPAVDQLAGDFKFNALPEFQLTLTGLLPLRYYSCSPSSLTERGPPFIC